MSYPSCRKGGMMVDATSSHPSLIYGGQGQDESYNGKVWSLSNHKFQPIPQIDSDGKAEGIPKPRWKGVLCSVTDSQAILFGGSNDHGFMNDVWLMNVNSPTSISWKEVSPSTNEVPAPRRAHSGVVLNSKSLVIFGGTNKQEIPLKDLWIFQIEKKAWVEYSKTVPFPGEARKGHSAVLIDSKMYVFGGRFDNSQYDDDLAVLEFNSNSLPQKWVTVTPIGNKKPSRRNHHIAAEIVNKRMVVYGGRAGHSLADPILTDLWVFDTQLQKWEEITPKPDPRLPLLLGYPIPRIEAAAGAIEDKRVLGIAFGRDMSAKVLNDAWLLDFSVIDEPAWKQVNAIDCSAGIDAPPPISSGMVYMSLGFFVGVLGLLALFWYSYSNKLRRAPYQPI